MIEEIRDYNKLGGIKKQLSNLATKVFVMNQLSARQNNAIMTLFKLQSRGVTEDQILRLCRYFEEYGSGMPSGFKQVQNSPYIFKQ